MNLLFFILIVINMTILSQSPIQASVDDVQLQISYKTLPKTLKEAYEAALHIANTENISAQMELLIQAKEGSAQAMGAMFPSLALSTTSLKQSAPSNTTANSFYPSLQNTVKFTVDQPLFRGFREFATLRQKKYLIDAQKYALLNSARVLFYDLSSAYYTVLCNEEDVKNYSIEIQVNQKRLIELEKFYKIGRNQLTDVLTFKSSIASLEVQLATARGQLELSKDALAFVTGWNRETPLEDHEKFEPTLQTVESYLNQLEERADIQNAKMLLEANTENISIMAGQHFPNLDLIGNYYAVRPGALKGVQFDVQLVLSLPLFQGGIVQSQVRQAQSAVRQYQTILNQARRIAETEIRTFYQACVADQENLKLINNLVALSKENADTEVLYYRNGLVTHLEVLQAMTTYQDAQRQLDRLQHLLQLNRVKLQAAIGKRSELFLSENFFKGSPS